MRQSPPSHFCTIYGHSRLAGWALTTGSALVRAPKQWQGATEECEWGAVDPLAASLPDGAG